MRVFVTGATGFIGSAIVQELLGAGYDVLGKSEEAMLAAVAGGVRGMVIRLSLSVHGDGDHGFVPALIQLAREKREAIYVGEGSNVWPAVHRLDAAKLYRLALERGTAGARFHGAAEEGIKTRDIAEAIARRLTVPAVSKTAEEAAERLGFIGHVLAMGKRRASAAQSPGCWKTAISRQRFPR
ncbi:MAG: 3-beta hydroxysteroid dehydrogenase [Polyangiaceae bacterium]|jgi:nucleoside-diphosphate-sugar epimerase|nr:3-beta hydroxysteroid dehydrogenase [Polyangiaceae bacterium]